MLTLDQLQTHKDALERQRNELLATSVMADFNAVMGALQSVEQLITMCDAEDEEDEDVPMDDV